MKRLLLLLVLYVAGATVWAQEDTLRVPPPADTAPSVPKVDTVPDTTKKIQQPPVIRRDATDKKDTTAPATIAPPPRPRVQQQDTAVAAVTANPVISKPVDTLPAADSLPVMTQVQATVYGEHVLGYINEHPYFNAAAKALNMPSRPFFPPDKDTLFYLLCGLLLFLALLRMAFPRYFEYLFTAFWRPAFRQAQTRDHLQESGATALAFNIFFVLSLGLFSCLIILYLKPDITDPLLLFAFCVLGILVLYSGKYLVFKLTGWMFGHGEVVSAYLFIVLLINKVLAVLLIPFLLILAFSDMELQQIAFTLSLILVIILFIYRYMLTFTGLRNDLKISALHLALFVLGFEIIPVLLIYRGLVQFFERSL